MPEGTRSIRGLVRGAAGARGPHVPQKTADFGNKESAVCRQFKLRSVLSPQCHTRHSLVNRANLIAAACRAWLRTAGSERSPSRGRPRSVRSSACPRPAMQTHNVTASPYHLSGPQHAAARFRISGMAVRSCGGAGGLTGLVVVIDVRGAEAQDHVCEKYNIDNRLRARTCGCSSSSAEE